MPMFGRLGDLHTVSYITGPSHVWLGIAFSQSPIPTAKVVMRPAIGDCNHGRLDTQQIQAAVSDGVADARVGLFVDRIEYVTNDSPRYDLYRDCARMLAERASACDA
jgi:hypothetical protein